MYRGIVEGVYIKERNRKEKKVGFRLYGLIWLNLEAVESVHFETGTFWELVRLSQVESY